MKIVLLCAALVCAGCEGIEYNRDSKNSITDSHDSVTHVYTNDMGTADTADDEIVVAEGGAE